MKEGDKAPEFTLPDQAGDLVSLADLKGKWVILYFYPKDNTPGCTIEAIEFTGIRDELEKANAVVFGVSKDDAKSHQSFRKKKKLTVTLLSDEDHQVQEKYGVWRPKKFLGREFLGTIRSTFLVDPQGIVTKIWDPVKAKGHAQEVLETLQSLI